MTPTTVLERQNASALGERLARESSIAVDCEAAGFHRYSDRLCLVQISTRDDTWLIDPFDFDPGDLLRPVLEDPDIRVIMHGADYDIRLLDRDLGINVRGLFDTQIAAAFLGEPSVGLSALLERHLDVRLSKKHQRADWARRPLPVDMLEYAAADTRHLHELTRVLEARLVESHRLAWAEEEFQLLEAIRWQPEEKVDPVTRVKGAKDLPPRGVAALRRALEWRDRIARERDRAPFRVAGDAALLEIATRRPLHRRELSSVKGISPKLLASRGEELIDALARVAAMDPDSIRPFPEPARRGPGRPPPEVEARVDRLKAVRNRLAGEYGIERGRLISNAALLELARTNPAHQEDWEGIPGVRRWQVAVLGEAFIRALGGPAGAGQA